MTGGLRPFEDLIGIADVVCVQDQAAGTSSTSLDQRFGRELGQNIRLDIEDRTTALSCGQWIEAFRQKKRQA
ncbi:hypothetical protein M5K25_020684 [Dendrobium thyrsiflorum]|uniref:Uncharacterized protein n=1 Tax=Dendrobium thyrsiflorum TaxID=117978 RepID=A0ABD0UHF5_DENTH